MNNFYGVYLNDHKEMRIIELEKRMSTLYSRNTHGEFTIPRYDEEFVNFINYGDMLELASKDRKENKNIVKVNFK